MYFVYMLEELHQLYILHYLLLLCMCLCVEWSVGFVVRVVLLLFLLLATSLFSM